MQATATEPSSLVSSRIYALILTSPLLKKMLLPKGLISSPYKVIDSQCTLALEDPKGMRATFDRTQQVEFLQSGVSGLMENLWGEGVPLTFYHSEAGRIEDTFKEQGRRHLIIGLKRPMNRGELLKFEVARRAMAQFTKDKEWMDVTIDHPTNHLAYSIVFPKKRPCQKAVLQSEGLEVPLSVIKLANGKTTVRFDVRQPRIDTPYTVRWSW